MYSNEFIRNFSWNGHERNRLLINLGDGQFAEAATAHGADSLGDGRGLAVSDFDSDGDLDMIVTNYNTPANYYVNQTPPAHWLRVRLRGRDSNRDGIGALVAARTGQRTQLRVVTAGDGFGSQYSRVVHFGLAGENTVDELTVTWPGGKKQTFQNVAADQLIEIDEYASQIQPVRLANRP